MVEIDNRKQVEGLIALSEAFVGAPDDLYNYDRLLDSLMGIIGCTSCSIHMLEPNEQSVYLVASKGVPSAIPQTILESTMVESMHEAYMLPLYDGMPYFPLDYTPNTIPFQGGDEFAEKEHELIGGLIKIPMFVGIDFVGAITVVRRECTRNWLADNSEWLSEIGRHVGAMLHRSRMAESARGREILRERRRMGRELHDNLAQCIAGLRMMAERISDKWDSGNHEGLGEDISSLRKMADESYAQVRSELEGLRFLKELEGDPAAEVAEYLAAYRERWGIETTLTVIDPHGSLRLYGVQMLQMFRIMQESLSNIQRHAEAKVADVTLEASRDRLRILIVDDGRGFDSSEIKPSSMGIRIMKERAKDVGAELRVVSAPGEGTMVSVELPLGGSNEMEGERQ